MEDTHKYDKNLDTTNVFVKFLPPDMGDEYLNGLFSPYGSIVSAKVMVDPHTWKSRGFGFVKYSKKEEAKLAIEKMSGYRIDNKTLMCKLSNTFTIAEPSPSLYIKPLPPRFSEQNLHTLFSDFGVIEAIKIVRDPKKPQDVVGLVRYLN